MGKPGTVTDIYNPSARGGEIGGCQELAEKEHCALMLYDDSSTDWAGSVLVLPPPLPVCAVLLKAPRELFKDVKCSATCH